MDASIKNFKQKVYEHYSDVLKNKITLLQQKLNDLIETTNNETKSSAGDKYETGRAMLQIEQDNVRKQLKDSLEQKALFDKIDINSKYDRIGIGSLVKTNKGYLFLSVALGKITVDEKVVVALSPQSPLGAKLVGLKVNEAAVFNGVEYLVNSLE
jgi:hypothetical protein